MKNLMKSCCWLALCFGAYVSCGALSARADFVAAVNYPVGTRPYDVATGDFNNDGKLDWVSANDGSANISIRLGAGDGTFGAVSHFSVGGPAAAIAVGDFNEDNNLDIVTADESSRPQNPNNPNGASIDRTTSLLLGNGDGTFAPAISFDGLAFAGGSQNPIDIAVADFNGDNNLDIATLTFGGSGWFNTTLLEIRPGNGNGTFADTIFTDLSYDAEQNYYYDYYPGGLTVGDFNGDARPDVVLSCLYVFGGSDNDRVHFLAGDGDGTFTRGSLFKVGTAPRGIASGDFNFDGKLDIVTANYVSTNVYYGSNSLSVLSGNGDGTFNAAVNYPVGTMPWGVIVGDFNGDGISDLVASNAGSNNVSLLFGDGTGAFGAASNYAVGTNPAGIAAGDFNGDGALDLAAANRGSDNVSILLQPSLLSINDLTVTEGNSGITLATFTVSLSRAAGQNVTVSYATVDGTAVQPDDYTGAGGTLTFTPGQISKPLTIAIKGDLLDESNEVFRINLSNAGNASIRDAQATGTIADNDATPALTINDVTLTEGNSGSINATFTITLSAASGQTVTVRAIPSNGSANAPGDYTSGGANLVFAPGETSKTLSVPVKGDLLDEADEVFYVFLSSAANASIGRGRGVGTITDDDATPTISIDNLSISEGSSGQKVASFSLRLSAPSGQVVKVTYATANGTSNPATAGNDYVEVAPTQIAFNTGQTVAIARVLINGDVFYEPNETFFVNLSAPSNATITNNQATGTILNDDAIPSITISDVQNTEGNSGTKNLTFTVTLSKAFNQIVTVNYASANGSAQAGSDYVAKSGTLTFTPGQTVRTISITINGDTLIESNEAFYVLLSSATNASIGRGRAIGTIHNDDSSE